MKAAVLLAVAGGLLSAGAVDFDVVAYGAATNGAAKTNAAAIQRALDEAGKAGGGRVVVPAGVFESGTVWLRDGVELHLAEGAVLQASKDLADYNALDAYPENKTTNTEEWRGWHLVIGYRVKGARLTGPGTIDGSSDWWYEDKPRWRDTVRPWGWLWGMRKARNPETGRIGQLVQFVGARDVFVGDGLLIRKSPCWCLHFHNCDGVTVRHYRVRNALVDGNSDGLDIDCSRNVLIEDCDIETGDDSIAIRGSFGRLPGGSKETTPCENVTIRRCRLYSAIMGVRIGVGAGVIRNVLIEDATVAFGSNGISLETFYGKGTDQGVDIENVTVRDSRFDNCYRNWFAQVGGERLTTGVRNVRFERCFFGAENEGEATGPLTNRMDAIVFDRVTRKPQRRRFPKDPFRTAADDLGVRVDFLRSKGPVHAVHGVGQGPLLGYDDFSMFRYLKEAGIPSARLHDVGGAFGMNLFVDIPNLFRDFDADENDLDIPNGVSATIVMPDGKIRTAHARHQEWTCVL